MTQALFIRFLFRAQNVNEIENQAPGPVAQALVRLGNITIAAGRKKPGELHASLW